MSILRYALILCGILALSAPAAPSYAQEGEEPAAPSEARVALDALQREFDESQEEYFRPFMEAKTPEEREKISLDPAKDPVPLFVPRFAALAREHAGSDEAVEAWTWVFQMGARSPRSATDVKEAVDTLLERYADHRALSESVRFVHYAGDTEATQRLLGGLWERSTVPETRAAVGYGLARLALESGGGGGEERARELFSAVAKDYSDVVMFRELTYGAQIEADLYELENLTDGKTAPEITGEDLDGAEFSLSDYRGKVVLLDFWGDW